MIGFRHNRRQLEVGFMTGSVLANNEPIGEVPQRSEHDEK